MSFKTLHSFTVSLNKEVEKIVSRVENGQEITIKSKVTEPVPFVICLKEPTRRERQELSLWYGKNYNEALTVHGLSPRVLMVQKFLKDPSSPLSQDDDKNLAKIYDRMEELKNDIVRINAIPDNDLTKDKKDKLLTEFISLQKKAIDVESCYQSLFAHTAENFAQNRAVSWLAIMLSYVKKGENNYEALFQGKDFAAKEECLYELEENKDELFQKYIDKLSTFWGLYFMGNTTSPEDFKKLEDEFNKQMAEKERVEKEVLEAKEKLKKEAEALETAMNEIKTETPATSDLPAPVIVE